MVFGAVIFVLTLALCLDFVMVLNNGLALTPPMGWMSWGYYMCGDDCVKNPDKCLNEDLIISVTDAISKEGYQEAGYEYIIIDDCWSERKRDENDRLVPDRKRFPRGMKFLADYIHDRGLKFGMYTNIGKDTCMRYPGSRDHFEQDAKMFAEFGVDYLKVDGCFVENEYLQTAYIDLGNELKKTKRPMVYGCSWPFYDRFIHNIEPNYEKVAETCNLWRNYHDIVTNFDAIYFIMKYYKENADLLRKYHKPGQWNDPDMLVLGTGSLTEGQARVQMAVWAMWSAPLLLSCDMRRVTQYEKNLLQNLDLIAIGQDPMGFMATPYLVKPELTMWVKRHHPRKGNQFHTFSFALVNVGYEAVNVTIMPSFYGLDSTDDHTVLDVFTAVYIKNITVFDSLDISVLPQGELYTVPVSIARDFNHAFLRS